LDKDSLFESGAQNVTKLAKRHVTDFIREKYKRKLNIPVPDVDHIVLITGL